LRIFEGETVDAISSEIVRHERAVPILGQVPPRQNRQPAMLRLARRKPTENPGGIGGGDKRSAGKDIIHAFAIGSVGGELLAPVVEAVAPGIHESADPHIKVQRFGTELPDASGVEPFW